MVVVVVVVDSWLCLFPKAAVLPFPRPLILAAARVHSFSKARHSPPDPAES